MNIIVSIFILGFVVFFHELGHYLVAKKNGITVIEFSIGMGPRLLKMKRNGTIYSIKLFPIGGSCQMLGEEFEDTISEGSFQSKSVYAKISTIFAGPLFNFILAFILALIIVPMQGYDKPVVNDLETNSVAYESGLRDGDIITKYNGKNIEFARDLTFELYVKPMQDTKKISIEYKRDKEIHKTELIPEKKTKYQMGLEFGELDAPAAIESIKSGFSVKEYGIQTKDVITSINGQAITCTSEVLDYIQEHPLNGEAISLTLLRDGKEINVSVMPKPVDYYDYGLNVDIQVKKASGFGVISYSLKEIQYWIRSTVKGLTYLVTGKISAKEMSGPVKIISSISGTAKESISHGFNEFILAMLNWALLITANLGVMNLLPIPALDGGRLFFLFLQLIRGKEMNRKVEEYAQIAGFICLMLLMVVVTFKDIITIFH